MSSTSEEFSLIMSLFLSGVMSDLLLPHIDKDALFAFALTFTGARETVFALLLRNKETMKTTFKSMTSSVPLIEWAVSCGCKYDNFSFWKPAKDGNLSVIQLLHKKKGCPVFCEFSYTLAAEGGHLECLKYMHENGCKWDNWSVMSSTRAARNGHLKCLQYMHENGCYMDSRTCSVAAYYGHLDILEWAYASKFLTRFNSGGDTCCYAAEGGHLDCLKFAYEKRCSYPSVYIKELAELNGHANILEWISEEEKNPSNMF